MEKEFKELAERIEKLESSRERSLAVTKLQEAGLWLQKEKELQENREESIHK